MKKTKMLLLLLLSITFACNKSVDQNEKFELKVKPVSKEILEKIYLDLKNINAFNSREEFKVVKQLGVNSNSLRNHEEDVANIIQPLVDNGRQIHSELLGYVNSSEAWNALTEEDKSVIINFSDAQLATLSLQYASAVESNAGYSVNMNAIKDCVGVALGLHGMKTLLVDIFIAPTIEGTIGLLRFIGKRYIGYIGIVWMVWDFYDCMSHF